MMNGIENTELISLTEFREFMFEHIVPLDDLVDTNGNSFDKSFPYWRRHGLLPFIPAGKKLEISFAQLIWVRMLDTLRGFSYTVENTKKVCDYFFKDAYDNNVPKQNLKYNREMLKKKKLAGTITEQEEYMLKYIDTILGDKLLLTGLSFDINYLSNLIINSITSGYEAGVLVFLNGEVVEHLGDNYFSHSKSVLNRNSPHIYLSIKYFLQEFIDSDELQTLLMPQILNDNEKSVLKELRNKNINELIIKKQGKDIFRFESSVTGIITGEQAKKIRNILALKNYEELHISTRDEKTLAFKSTRKKINSG